MRDLVGLQLRKNAWSFIVLLIACAALALLCLISVLELGPFDAWANSASKHEAEQQAPEEKQSKEQGAASSSVAESDKASGTGAQLELSDRKQIPSFGEQIGPWYAIQDKTVNELIGVIDRRLLFESPRTNLAVPLVFGISLVGVLGAALFIHRHKGQRT